MGDGMKRTLLLTLGLMLAWAASAATKPPVKTAAPTLPSYFTIPSSIGVATEGGGAVTFEDFGEAEFYQDGSDDAIVKRGKHWAAPLELRKPPKDIDGKGIWAVIKPSLIAGGWTIPIEYDSNPFSAMMRYQKDGRDVWGYIKIFGVDDLRLNIVEVGGPANILAINPPAPTPEKITAEKGDFPYLPPLPGSKLGIGARQDGAMEITVPGSDEIQVVGTGSVVKYYPIPPGLSTIAFVSAYHEGLVKAGWTIISEGAGVSQTDATLTAHYARNGRDLWAYLHMGGEEYSIKVADAGADNDIARQFARDCHVALYGVLFDFNKATLKTESDGVLQRVLTFASKDPTLKIEVQGHTDNVGGDDYNQKLSEARSKSVLGWLTERGVIPARLTYKGYGRSRPVATNDSDEGRAKNRRVEIARPGCVK
jgi:OOP family OmpA-OmpF porin